jgi:hypothetical protein
MRWWLALAFAGIAALTALAVAQVFTARSESAIRERAQELVAGAAVAAAAQIPQDATAEEIRTSLARFGTSRQLALFAFAPDGELVTPERAGGVAVEDLSNVDQLLATALEGRRAVESVDDGRVVTVALPLRRDRAAALSRSRHARISRTPSGSFRRRSSRPRSGRRPSGPWPGWWWRS